MDKFAKTVSIRSALDRNQLNLATASYTKTNDAGFFSSVKYLKFIAFKLKRDSFGQFITLLALKKLITLFAFFNGISPI